MLSSRSILLCYVPVLHSGYIELFKKYPNKLYLIGDWMIGKLSLEIPYYGRDIRAVPSSLMASAIRGMGLVALVEELSDQSIQDIVESQATIIAPDEDITEAVIERYFSNSRVEYETIFLRWDKKITEHEYQVNPNHLLSQDSNDIEFAALSKKAAGNSSDWWRQVGAVLVENGNIIETEYNRHFPHPHSPYAIGDPRNNYDVGQGPHYYTSIHAEAAVIAGSVKKGISLEGAAIYVSTFPCPTCARLIRESGIARVYYSAGYSALDAEPILKEAGIELIYVPLQGARAE